MEISRRSFLKIGGATGLVFAFGSRNARSQITSRVENLKILNAKETKVICPFCSVGCGAIIHSQEGRMINIEGDAEHPINRGTLCPKGAGAIQLGGNSPTRFLKPLYRAPYSQEWEDKSWEWCIERIAQLIKKARDESFERTNKRGQLVNRMQGFAFIGGSCNHNEECYAWLKLLRSWGAVNVDNHARICHSPTVPALAETFGRGAMTNHPIDIRNTDCALILGSNMAENHPCAFPFVMEAMRNRDAKLIVVDPRFNRTAAHATLFAEIRPGSDIAFVGGMLRYIIENERYHEDYVKWYTNAPYIVDGNFKTATDLDGIFPGLHLVSLDGQDADISDGQDIGSVAGGQVRRGYYDRSSWRYQSRNGRSQGPASYTRLQPQAKIAPVDRTLRDPQCVFQLLRRHFSRYTPETVSQTTGIEQDLLLRIYDTFSATGTPDKAGCVMYAMGQTQHTTGVQNIRMLGLVQLLLGNIGKAGGGVNALRGHSNVQGATDNPVLYHILPGYLAMPKASQQSWEAYLRAITPAEIQPADDGPRALNYWKNTPAFASSMWKAWWGEAARPDNGFAYHYMPKLESDLATQEIEDRYDHISIFHKMARGIVKGLWLMGQNPAVGGPNAAFERKAMRNLDFLVVHDFHESESASVWQEVSDPGIDPEQVKTEVFLLPAAGPFEREGSKTHTGRWIQWFHAAVRPYGESKDEIEVATLVHFKVKELYETEGGAFPDPLVELLWNFHPAGPFQPPTGPFEHVSARAVAREINGYALADIRLADGTLIRKGEQLPGFHALRADGTTACGNWIYSGFYTEEGNLSARRNADDPTGMGLHPGWAFSWPANRRILYNRASVDLQGRPWDPKRPVIWWTGSEWAGDVPDGGEPPGAIGPFIMKPEGVGGLFGPGPVDGPFPEHYEPFESQVPNLFSPVQTNPVVWRWDNVDPEATPLALFDSPERANYPHVCSTWRLTEYLTSMSRNVVWLAQLQPQMFVEISKELGAELAIESGEIVAVDSIRGRVVCRALVTPRVWPLRVNGKTLHIVGMPWHWGYKGFITGDIANNTTPDIGDPNTQIEEAKAYLVRVEKATEADRQRYQQILASAEWPSKPRLGPIGRSERSVREFSRTSESTEPLDRPNK